MRRYHHESGSLEYRRWSVAWASSCAPQSDPLELEYQPGSSAGSSHWSDHPHSLPAPNPPPTRSSFASSRAHARAGALSLRRFICRRSVRPARHKVPAPPVATANLESVKDFLTRSACVSLLHQRAHGRRHRAASLLARTRASKSRELGPVFEGVAAGRSGAV